MPVGSADAEEPLPEDEPELPVLFELELLPLLEPPLLEVLPLLLEEDPPLEPPLELLPLLEVEPALELPLLEPLLLPLPDCPLFWF